MRAVEAAACMERSSPSLGIALISAALMPEEIAITPYQSTGTRTEPGRFAAMVVSSRVVPEFPTLPWGGLGSEGTAVGWWVRSAPVRVIIGWQARTMTVKATITRM